MKPVYPGSRRASPALDPARRRLLAALGAGSALGGASLLLPRAVRAATPAAPMQSLSGSHFDLDIGALPVDFAGHRQLATAVNGSVPGPILRWREGSEVTIRVTNRLSVPTSIHWHGILLPADQDGVPGLSFDGIAPGETYTYRFPVLQSGTYWYHSHSGFQEQTGHYGALVIEPSGGERYPAERDYVVMLNDWSAMTPERIFARLKKSSDSFNYNQPTVGDFLRDAREMGLSGALADRRMWNQMRMSPTDFSDVTGAAYTYLINGRTPADNWTGLFQPGERVRLRFINGSAQSIFDVRIPGLKMTVVAADGQDVEPVAVDEFRISVAETYDVIVEPREDRAYTLFAQSIDRLGHARATLAPRAGMEAAVPAVDPVQWLTMRDMMGDMGGMDMAGMSGDSMNHHHHGGGMAMPGAPVVRHAVTETGPGVDMLVDTPRTNLDDPGVGLRDNGRRVLTYADLRTVGGSEDARGPAREIELHLTGSMERFIWSLDGVPFADATPIHLRQGERVRFTLHNDTMMNHPIHLHGMWSELEDPDGRFRVRKHTINVQPAQRVSYGVSAHTPGRWAYHCHLLYHMDAGMFREVVVA